MKRELRLEYVYPHPPEKVWRALTDSKAIAEWLMPNDFEPRVGHKFQLRTDPQPGFDGIVHCEVLEIDEPRRLSYSWKGGPIDTVLTFTLEPVPDGTRLKVVQSGFEGVKAILVSFILGSGSKKIYSTLLPDVIARIDPDGTIRPRATTHEETCDKKGAWQVLTFLFSPFLRSKKD